MSEQQPSKAPNILLILTDDMGYGDVATSGNPKIKTPNLDDLARTSVRFENFYVSSVCAPTRASLLTGRYHQRTGVRSVTNGFETMDPDEVTLAEILKQHGYRTGIFGKWHLGEYYPSIPNAQGFDEFLGFRTGHTNYYYNAMLEHNGQQVNTRGHITDVLTDAALNFMTDQSEEPFLCYLAYNAPHTPLQVDSSWWQPYIKQGLEEREARIYGMIEHLDLRIGQILDSLRVSAILENTLVLFMSDNGPISGWQLPQDEMRYNAGLRDQKFTIYDGGIRTQCYWMWKDHWQPKVVEQVSAHIDVLPTLLDIIGIRTLNSPDIDGVSLKASLESGTESDPERIFYQKYSLETLLEPAPFPGGMARKGSWKMVNGTELYNLDNDVGEMENLVKEQPDIFSELKSSYLSWYQGIAEERGLKKIPITIGYPQENPVYLQPHHAEATGKVKFWGNRGLTGEKRGTHPRGVDSDWTGEWQAAGDALVWNVSLVTGGEYSFSIIARDSTAQEINTLVLEINQQIKIQPADPIRLSQNWEVFEMGSATLGEGSYNLNLILEENIGNTLEIKELIIEN
ncbi:MAG: hypothetical protein DHS20C17_33500 [Cyclobacteriaceae bacterium]|nr:MAG: hypothetical protein DHS20C17_33500 [Cyclobacteriaceae bacterium]